MKIIVGLGNPGAQYDKTRHNVGFKILDSIVGEANWHLDKKFNAYVCEKNGDLFIKPLTFMNKSGESVAAVLNYYHLIPKKLGIFKTKDADLTEILTVVHDDLDVDLGKFKIALNSSSAGHNGVQSIINYLKTKNFKRIRVGVRTELRAKMPADKFVLGRFSEEELKNINTLLPDLSSQI